MFCMIYGLRMSNMFILFAKKQLADYKVYIFLHSDVTCVWGELD